jgi:hypothetical protein
MPGQKQRKKSVRQKLSAIELEFKGNSNIHGEYLLTLEHCCVKILPCLLITIASPGAISRVIL